MAMQPQPSPQLPPARLGSGEPDIGPAPSQGAAPAMAPTQPQQPAQDMSVENDGSQPQDNPGTAAIQQKLDALPDQDKQFLSQYLTPEFVYAIGLVAGPEAAQYLGQFTDKSKVLVPVSRDEAAKIQQAVQQHKAQQGQQPQPAQGQPQPAPQQAHGAPVMKPQPMPQQPQQTLPNGVTPAPMQGGVMAPQA